MATTQDTSEKWYEKHAWIVFLIIGIVFLASSFGTIFTGGEAEWSQRYESITGTKWSALASSDPNFFKFINLVNIESGV